jgi:hypothetical protein
VIIVSGFEPELATWLPATYALLRTAQLAVHPRVSCVVLHGSRGLARSHRPNSDIDLSLIVDSPPSTTQSQLEPLLRAVFATTQSTWRSPIELDLAVVFATRACALACFEETAWRETICTLGGVDCFGLYKLQKGYHGFVTNVAIQVKQMYPCLRIWRRP